jgi:uncharacterized protein with HEPN domain
MPRDFSVYLDDILLAVARIREYTSGVSREEFQKDQKTLDAVVRNLQVIGEAVKRLPEDLRARHAEVDWKKVAGLRDMLIHEYFGVDAEIVWDVVQNKLGDLEKAVGKIPKG